MNLYQLIHPYSGVTTRESLGYRSRMPLRLVSGRVGRCYINPPPFPEVTSMQHWISLSIAIASGVVATSLLRGIRRIYPDSWPSLVVIVGYAISFYRLSLALKNHSHRGGLCDLVRCGYRLHRAGRRGCSMASPWISRRSSACRSIILGVVVLNLFSKPLPIEASRSTTMLTGTNVNLFPRHDRPVMPAEPGRRVVSDSPGAETRPPMAFWRRMTCRMACGSNPESRPSLRRPYS
jgi:hypothetical protein